MTIKWGILVPCFQVIVCLLKRGSLWIVYLILVLMFSLFRSVITDWVRAVPVSIYPVDDEIMRKLSRL